MSFPRQASDGSAQSGWSTTDEEDLTCTALEDRMEERRLLSVNYHQLVFDFDGESEYCAIQRKLEEMSSSSMSLEAEPATPAPSMITCSFDQDRLLTPLLAPRSIKQDVKTPEAKHNPSFDPDATPVPRSKKRWERALYKIIDATSPPPSVPPVFNTRKSFPSIRKKFSVQSIQHKVSIQSFKPQPSDTNEKAASPKPDEAQRTVENSLEQARQQLAHQKFEQARHDISETKHLQQQPSLSFTDTTHRVQEIKTRTHLHPDMISPGPEPRNTSYHSSIYSTNSVLTTPAHHRRQILSAMDTLSHSFTDEAHAINMLYDSTTQFDLPTPTIRAAVAKIVAHLEVTLSDFEIVWAALQERYLAVDVADEGEVVHGMTQAVASMNMFVEAAVRFMLEIAGRLEGEDLTGEMRQLVVVTLDKSAQVGEVVRGNLCSFADVWG